MFSCYVIKIVVGDYDFKFFKTMILGLKVKTIVDNYNFEKNLNH